jgi:hypothetical protein
MNITTPLPGVVMVVDVTVSIAACILPGAMYIILTSMAGLSINLQALKVQRYKLFIDIPNLSNFYFFRKLPPSSLPYQYLLLKIASATAKEFIGYA